MTNLIGIVPLFCCKVALHGDRLGDLQGLHAVVVQAKHLGALEANNKSLHALNSIDT